MIKFLQMKRGFLFLMLLMTTTGFAQQENHAIKKCISTFFDGMKANDTMMIHASLDTSCFLYTVKKANDGRTVLESETMADFLKQLDQLKGNELDEQLMGYDIKVDGELAIAWTPYKFYYNGRFSHCGVNVFTLIKRSDGWKIMGITDTRRKQGCD